MSGKPAFFERIRKKAARQWDQLEADPELAGPWHQLFKQVQSPRHVLSELLQNADDAHARQASVRLEGDSFVFEHDGEDFLEDHFASLCRFGYSNKRALHTIGFRGIGFKSTFSLGERVEVSTPTLSFYFEQRRFTQPAWIEGSICADGKTRIRVSIADPHRRRELEKNLDEWRRSPVSLLFFKSIRRLQVGDQTVHWRSLGQGPVPLSQWMTLEGDDSKRLLIVRSEPEGFPEDSLVEIRQERMLSAAVDTDFPPSTVEVVLGTQGRLYVVLPTGVATSLPFACNAPFIQDPARLKIKDPETSPTNRWLLKRTGELAARAMLSWLEQSAMPSADRAMAYGLFPDVNREDHSLDGSCGTAVEKAFESVIDPLPFLLTDGGTLELSAQAVILPNDVLDVWPVEKLKPLFDERNRPPLSRHIGLASRKKLASWGVAEEIGYLKILERLRTQAIPSTESSQQLAKLWTYLAPVVAAYGPETNLQLRIVPVQGKDTLDTASMVIRLSERRALDADRDWQFLSRHLLVVSQDWLKFLAEDRRLAEARTDGAQLKTAGPLQVVLKKLSLDEPAELSTVIDRVASGLTGKGLVADWVHLAQIAARLGVSAGGHFRFVTRDIVLRAPKDAIFDKGGTIEELVPEKSRDIRLLHGEYLRTFSACSQDEWSQWIASGRAGLPTFLSPVQQIRNVYGRETVRAEIRRRGSTEEPYFNYKTSMFALNDWDFEEVCWKHWETIAAEDERSWGRIGDAIFGQSATFWSRVSSVPAVQIATTGSTYPICAPVLPGWLIKFRGLPCLRDTRGFYRKPGDLLRRTPETESLMDVEPFVHGSLDTEAIRPLLELLGVQATPTGPGRLLDRLRALAGAGNPPIAELERWYRRLDQMVDTCSTADLHTIKEAFRKEALILTDSGVWATSPSTFLGTEEQDVPGAAIVRASVRDLTLWRKVGVAERPTAALAIEWLSQLPSGQRLTPSELPRVLALLSRHPVRVWECGHWLSLAGEWVPTESLRYAMTLKEIVPWSHLHEAVKGQTGDFRRLPSEVTSVPPFSSLPSLAARLEERLVSEPLLAERPEPRHWLNTLGVCLCRVVLEEGEQTARVRELARTLADTLWQNAPGLETIPYLDGVPAGTSRRADVLWRDRILYVSPLPVAKLARRVPEEVGRAFNVQAIKSALDYGFERSPEDIRLYLEENFKLAPIEVVDDGASRQEPAEATERPADDPRAEEATSDEPEPAMDNEDEASQEDEGSTPEHDDVPDPEEGSSSSEEDGESENDDDEPETRAPAQPTRPSIIARFAAVAGFKKSGEDRFTAVDGSWIAKVRGEIFPWERRTAKGELVRYYLPEEHCLEHEPLEVDAEVWSLIESAPKSYALVLVTAAGEPVEVHGVRLRELKDQGTLKIYPAAYRLVIGSNANV